MQLHFYKYQGTGNDFIMLDDRNQTFPSSAPLIKKLCDRRYGIGADGLILIQEHSELDYRMVYYNADGSQSLCGNGSRCGYAFALELGMVAGLATFETTDGIHQIKKQENLIHFQLSDVSEVKQLNETGWFVNTGSPHHVVILQTDEEPDVVAEGRKIRNAAIYTSQNGTNVNFARLLQSQVKMRTYERGVEDETLSCGTGATAVGLVAGMLGYKSPVALQTAGGHLTVTFQKSEDRFTDIWLAGPAEKVFEGSITI